MLNNRFGVAGYTQQAILNYGCFYKRKEILKLIYAF